jgi:HEAT repeat protein
VADARPNAVSFLVQVGQPAVNALMPMLDNKDKDVRLAAADALGKIRARNAVDKLLTMLENAKQKSASPDEYPALLAALAGIGDPKTEPILTSVLLDESIPVPMRSTAALGLGRISTPSSVTTDWKYANDADLQLRQSVVSGLRVAGDLALRMHQSLDSALVEVASGISSPSADQALVRAINNPALESQAVRACAYRPSVVPALRAKLLTLDVDSDGELATLLIETLRTTKSGNAVVESVRSKPEYLGLLAR